jgi:hypothetical protein
VCTRSSSVEVAVRAGTRVQLPASSSMKTWQRRQQQQVSCCKGAQSSPHRSTAHTDTRYRRQSTQINCTHRYKVQKAVRADQLHTPVHARY